MLFLGGFYQQIILPWAQQFNHLPLVKLMVESLDKTILYCLIYLACRLVYCLVKHRSTSIREELHRFVFVFYVCLLVSLTVLRHIYYPWQLQLYVNRPLSQINLTPFVETLKLRQAPAQLDYWYNLYGNILWFIPFGWLKSGLAKKPHSAFKVICQGALLSLGIESAQFILGTGLADIDDLIFNTIGAIIGVILYQSVNRLKKR
ncbi:VanZ family protein [Latilactobacillus fuchuensis]|uniref:VanZ-like domain-containing protein n=1 Tax=Latilactobacillus fuchuensis TaxID=164393 RepID=A0A2N9DY97_9LACO|nr:VanZ family protein [Latilactobacillus fuchuensis]SPC40115.1 conserved membrane hypothetical protein [Latilactobacillus fuchuensis]